MDWYRDEFLDSEWRIRCFFITLIAVYYSVFAFIIIDYFLKLYVHSYWHIMMINVMYVLGNPNVMTIAIGIYLLCYLKKYFRREYNEYKWSIMGFIFCEFLGSFF
jgi:hypothetical protein